MSRAVFNCLRGGPHPHSSLPSRTLNLIRTAVDEEDASPAEKGLGRRDKIHPRGTVSRCAKRRAGRCER